MRYISTRGAAPALGFTDVLLAGLARDGGLYVPETWPKVTADEIRALRGLRYEEIATGFETLSAPALLVGGTADESWDGELARRAGHEVLELEGANHALQIEADPLASIDALRRVVERMDAFVAALGQ